MKSRIAHLERYLGLAQPLIEFMKYAQQGLDARLAKLILIRASQINGCGPCLYMHTHEARQQGETEERIYLLDAWRESPLYNQRERAALGWTDALTLVRDVGAPDDAYEALKRNFSDQEQIKMTLLIGGINAFNRLNIGFHVEHPAANDDKAA